MEGPFLVHLHPQLPASLPSRWLLGGNTVPGWCQHSNSVGHGHGGAQCTLLAPAWGPLKGGLRAKVGLQGPSGGTCAAPCHHSLHFL